MLPPQGSASTNSATTAVQAACAAEALIAEINGLPELRSPQVTEQFRERKRQFARGVAGREITVGAVVFTPEHLPQRKAALGASWQRRYYETQLFERVVRVAETPLSRSTGPIIEWAVSDQPIAYQAALEAMHVRATAIRDGRAAELIWLLEHPALYTAGTSAQDKDLLDPKRLPVFAAGRGGQYTYHGPGQRIAYVMLDLKARGGDVRALVAALERWVIDTLAAFNVKGESRPGRVGIWVRRPAKNGNEHGGAEDKIAALGLRVSRGVTTHGISLNVEPDLNHYSGIVACGLSAYGVTSLADLGLTISMSDVDVALCSAFENQFGAVHRTAPPSDG